MYGLVTDAKPSYFFFFQAEDGIRDYKVTGVQTCALPIYTCAPPRCRLLTATCMGPALPSGAPVLGFTSKRGKLLLEMSRRMRWPLRNRLEVGMGSMVMATTSPGVISSGCSHELR